MLTIIVAVWDQPGDVSDDVSTDTTAVNYFTICASHEIRPSWSEMSDETSKPTLENGMQNSVEYLRYEGEISSSIDKTVRPGTIGTRHDNCGLF